MSTWRICLLAATTAWLVGYVAAPGQEPDEPPPAGAALVVAVGAGGSDAYAEQFAAWAQKWRTAAERAGATISMVGLENDAADADLQRLLAVLETQGQQATPEPLWIVLIGHGTFDGKVAKFNLRGPDLSAAQLQDALSAAQRPLVVINCTSCSAPFVNALSGENRVVITSTRNGFERNFARFGEYVAEAIQDLGADLDKDDQVSVLEAFVAAAGQTTQFYAGESRLATEHALLDDNGDGLGTPAEWFEGTRATRAARDGGALDGFRANQIHLLRSDREQQLSAETRARRDELERQLETLRQHKAELSVADYDTQLESLLVALARLYEGID